jgi:hypothetical protein
VSSPKFDFVNGVSSAYDDWNLGQAAGAGVGCIIGSAGFGVGCIGVGAVGYLIGGPLGAIYGWSQGISDNSNADPFNTGQPDGPDPVEPFRAYR